MQYPIFFYIQAQIVVIYVLMGTFLKFLCFVCTVSTRAIKDIKKLIPHW